jgi:hypothetical protein
VRRSDVSRSLSCSAMLEIDAFDAFDAFDGLNVIGV